MLRIVTVAPALGALLFLGGVSPASATHAESYFHVRLKATATQDMGEASKPLRFSTPEVRKLLLEGRGNYLCACVDHNFNSTLELHECRDMNGDGKPERNSYRKIWDEDEVAHAPAGNGRLYAFSADVSEWDSWLAGRHVDSHIQTMGVGVSDPLTLQAKRFKLKLEGILDDHPDTLIKGSLKTLGKPLNFPGTSCP